MAKNIKEIIKLGKEITEQHRSLQFCTDDMQALYDIGNGDEFF